MQQSDTVLAEIHSLAAAALRQPGLPSAAAEALSRILSLTGTQPGDTPEESDLPQTENQSL